MDSNPLNYNYQITQHNCAKKVFFHVLRNISVVLSVASAQPTGTVFKHLGYMLQLKRWRSKQLSYKLDLCASLQGDSISCDCIAPSAVSCTRNAFFCSSCQLLFFGGFNQEDVDRAKDSQICFTE